MPLPSFLIVGVPRAGTTSLAAYLAAHPDVFMAEGKELHFFNGWHDRGLEWYSRQFETSRPVTQRGEATPGYLYRADAIDRLSQTVPGAKLIVVLREPVDRAYSHFWLNRWRGIEPMTFEAALAAEGARLADEPHDPRRAYFDMGDYVSQLRRLLGHYPVEQVHTVFFEDLKKNPGDVVTELCRFLEVRELVPSVTGDRHNHHGPVRSVPVSILARRLPGPLCRAVRRLNTRDAEYPRMDPETRRALSARFADANRDLPTLINRRPPWLDSVHVA